MAEEHRYTTKLGAGLGAVEETLTLLETWEPGMNKVSLLKTALESGRLSSISARRLKNIVYECFSHRYMVTEDYPVSQLKRLKDLIGIKQFKQILLIFSARVNPIVFDFITEVYWPAYSGGQSYISIDTARRFVETANSQGKTTTNWTANMIERVYQYLLGICVDFGLLGKKSNADRVMNPFNIYKQTSAFLAYDLHLSGMGDNAVIRAADWKLFGLEEPDVHEEMAALSRTGMLIYQRAGESVRIGWTKNSWDEVIHGIAQL